MEEFSELGFKATIKNHKGIEIDFPKNLKDKRGYCVALPDGFVFYDVTKEDALRLAKKFS